MVDAQGPSRFATHRDARHVVQRPGLDMDFDNPSSGLDPFACVDLSGGRGTQSKLTTAQLRRTESCARLIGYPNHGRRVGQQK